MSVKKEANGRRSVQVEVEVPGPRNKCGKQSPPVRAWAHGLCPPRWMAALAAPSLPTSEGGLRRHDHRMGRAASLREGSFSHAPEAGGIAMSWICELGWPA